MDAVEKCLDRRYGNYRKYLTRKETLRAYRHYFGQILAAEQEELESHREVYPYRFCYIGADILNTMGWCQENMSDFMTWDYSEYLGTAEISFKDKTDATCFYLVFGGEQVEKA